MGDEVGGSVAVVASIAGNPRPFCALDRIGRVPVTLPQKSIGYRLLSRILHNRCSTGRWVKGT
jgi:hypothetical protein